MEYYGTARKAEEVKVLCSFPHDHLCTTVIRKVITFCLKSYESQITSKGSVKL